MKKKMKIKRFTIFLCLVLLLSGCSNSVKEAQKDAQKEAQKDVQPAAFSAQESIAQAGGGKGNEKQTDNQQTDNQQIDNQQTDNQQTDNQQIDNQQTDSQQIDNQQLDFSSIKGKIRAIYPAGGTKILVIADQISLFDITDNTIIASTEDAAMSQIRVFTLEDGYAMVGQAIINSATAGFVAESTEVENYVVFYDKSLKEQSKLNISSLLSDEELLPEPETIAISPDGTQIAYATMQRVALYDRINNKSNILIDLSKADQNARLGIVAMEQMGFTNGGKTIAFKAQSFTVPAVEGKPSFDTIGTVNIDGSGLTNKKVDGYAAKMLLSYENRLLVAEDFKTASGRMMVIAPPDGTPKIYPLVDSQEGYNIYGSNSGQYFASSVLSKTGWMIRVYDSTTGTLVSEQDISNQGQELYSVNDPVLCVLEELKIGIVLLGQKQEVETKIAVFSF